MDAPEAEPECSLWEQALSEMKRVHDWIVAELGALPKGDISPDFFSKCYAEKGFDWREHLAIIAISGPSIGCRAMFRVTDLVARTQASGQSKMVMLLVDCGDHDEEREYDAKDLTDKFYSHIFAVARGVVEELGEDDKELLDTLRDMTLFREIYRGAEPEEPAEDKFQKAIDAATRKAPPVDSILANNTVCEMMHFDPHFRKMP